MAGARVVRPSGERGVSVGVAMRDTEKLKRDVAEKIMKWLPVRDMAHGQHYWASDAESQGWVCWEGRLPDWPGDLTSAFGLVRKLAEKGLNLSLVTFEATKHAEAMFLTEEEISTGRRDWGKAWGENAIAEAICIAAIKAYGRLHL
jgi:hypothetical protein